MAVRSTRLWTVSDLGVGPTIIYTVPSGRTAIVRVLQVYNQHASVAVRGRILLNGTTLSAVRLEFETAPRSIGSSGLMFLRPGDVLRFEMATGSGPVNCFGDGSLLLGEPQ